MAHSRWMLSIWSYSVVNPWDRSWETFTGGCNQKCGICMTHSPGFVTLDAFLGIISFVIFFRDINSILRFSFSLSSDVLKKSSRTLSGFRQWLRILSSFLGFVFLFCDVVEDPSRFNRHNLIINIWKQTTLLRLVYDPFGIFRDLFGISLYLFTILLIVLLGSFRAFGLLLWIWWVL